MYRRIRSTLRRSFTIIAAACGLLCIVTTASWIASYTGEHELYTESARLRGMDWDETLNGIDCHQLWQKLNERGLPNLWLPAERDFLLIAEMPLLGSGKLDLKRLKEMLTELPEWGG